MSGAHLTNPLAEYWVDAWQRSILFLDVLRDRAGIYQEHKAEAAPNVLDFEAELVSDGRTLARPVNYLLVRIVPPDGVTIDPAKPPFVVVDPRAGHGPGIGGMKQSSEIGVALAAGHACYFIGFLPDPEPGQTIEDVCDAEAAFIGQVAARHREADGQPVVIANCQAGWQTMIAAALHPEFTGPIVLAGSPLSYAAGVRGQGPMRYLGGLLGGTWLTAMAGDLGAGKFDGANLVANFESMHPDNTWWTKPYNVYANVDTEAERFLDFETWWGSPVVLNAQEMQWIADNLFVGNKLTAGQISSRDGVRIDLRNVNSPVVVFCSWGDDITPPPQALDWITDLYTDENEIKAAGKTIVYALHQTVGHLGIFVSGKVADKEHAEFASCMSMIEVMPAGLYEAVIDKPEAETANPALIEGGYLFRLEPRTLDHIRALGQTSPEDQRRFATAARVSETNKTLYDAFAAPFVRSLANPASAAVLRRMHPNRLRFAAFSDWNPWMNAVGPMAETIRQNRRPVAKDNPLLALEEAMSSAVTSGLKAYGNLRDAAAEATFLRTYGSPMLQAMAGVTADASAPGPRSPGEPAPQTDPAHFEDRLERGGPFEACVRALLFVRGPEGGADERAFNMIRDLRAARPESQRLTKAQIKQTLQEQTALLSWDGVRAINAVAHMLPADAGDRHRLMETLRAVLTASGGLSAEAGKRLNRVEALFGAADHPHGAVRHA